MTLLHICSFKKSKVYSTLVFIRISLGKICQFYSLLLCNPDLMIEWVWSLDSSVPARPREKGVPVYQSFDEQETIRCAGLLISSVLMVVSGDTDFSAFILG